MTIREKRRDVLTAALLPLLIIATTACSDGSDDPEDGETDPGTDAVADPDAADGADTADGAGDPVPDGTDTTGDTAGDTTPPDGCAFPAGGSEVTVTPGSPVDLGEATGTAMNTMDLESGGLLADPVPGILRHGPCGDVRLLVRTDDAGTMRLGVVDPTTGGTPEIVDASLSAASVAASLFLDGDCVPVVVRASGSDGFVEYVRESGGTWGMTVVLDDFTSVLGTDPSSLSVVASHEGADGLWYVFLAAGWGTDAQMVRARRDPASGSAWSFEEIPVPEATQVFGYWVDAAGATHSVYRNTEYPCDPCNVDTLHAVLDDGGTAWTVEVLHEGSWGAPNDVFIDGASMAFDAAGDPYVAAFWTERVITGSFANTDLVFYGKLSGGEWCEETVASTSDGFAGADGEGFTGADPVLFVDGEGRFHVAFTDQAVWHASGMQNEMRGQIRHAVRCDGAWTTGTLLAQDGQTTSPDPLQGLAPPAFSLSPDGTQIVVAATLHSWETDSIYNDTDVPVTWTARAIDASVGP